MSEVRRRARGVLRLPVLVGVPLVLVVLALVAAAVGSASVPASPPATASLVAPVGSESSIWYCPGPGGQLASSTTLELVNTSGAAVTGTVESVTAKGSTGSQAVSVPARSQVAVDPGSSVGGSAAATVDLAGGGVGVTEVVHGSAGWSQTACVTTPSDQWVFPVGATSGGASLTVSLYNPTSSTAVANLTFLTSSGSDAPQSFQGIVVPSGGVVQRDVGTYVQGQGEVATVVSVRSGQLVASVLAQDGGNGLSLSTGAPSAASTWNIGRVENVSGGSVAMYLANPTGRTVHASVSVQLPTGPIPAVHLSIGPSSVGEVNLGALTRIPLQTGYLTRVQTTGGGVVVGRVVQEPGGGSGSWGASLGANEVVGRGVSAWLLPAPPGAVSGASVSAVTVVAPSDRAVRVRLSGVGATASAAVRSISVPAGGSLTVTPANATQPLEVLGTAGASVSEDLTPGAVTFQAVPAAGGG